MHFLYGTFIFTLGYEEGDISFSRFLGKRLFCYVVFVYKFLSTGSLGTFFTESLSFSFIFPVFRIECIKLPSHHCRIIEFLGFFIKAHEVFHRSFILRILFEFCLKLWNFIYGVFLGPFKHPHGVHVDRAYFKNLLISCDFFFSLATPHIGF